MDTSTITTGTVIEFLVFLEEHKRLNPRTILNYRARLRLPFRLAFSYTSKFTKSKPFS